MPPEWAPHERCWMAWPCRPEVWGDVLAEVRVNYAQVANAIAAFEPVYMLTPPEHMAHARVLCRDAVSLVCAQLDDSWMRDIGPNFLVDGKGGLAASIFHFNAWGGKYEVFRNDAALGHRLAEYLGIRAFSSPLYMEGGGINVDGEGTVLTSEQCVLHENRNPGLSKAGAEAAFSDALGISKTLWAKGDPWDVETDGHIDGIACFVRPGVVLVEVCPNPNTERYDAMQANLEALQGGTDAKGRTLEVLTIEEAYEAEPRGDIFASSYINFYIANDAVVMPGFGIERDAQARETVQALFPEREIVQVDINHIACGGGGIHCITQQQPRV